MHIAASKRGHRTRGGVMSSSLATQPFPQPSSGAAELASSGAATFDGYRLIQRINKGKLAHVYKALSPSGEIVALKIFHGLGPVAQYSYVAEANAAIRSEERR